MKKLIILFCLMIPARLWAATCPSSRFPEYPKLDNVLVSLCNSVTNVPVSSMDTSGASGQCICGNGAGNSPTYQTPSSSLGSYRRPNIIWKSTNSMTVETGLDGTAGDAVLMFPDGTTRTETSSAFILIYASNTASSSQGGIRVSTAIINSFYRFYGVKTGTTDWELVADTNDCVSANFSFLNTVFGSNSWACLNLGRFGDGTPTATGFVAEKCGDSICQFYNSGSPNTLPLSSPGIQEVLTAASGAASLAYTAGMIGTNIPPSITHVWMFGSTTNVGSPDAVRMECDSGSSGNFRKLTLATVAGLTTGAEFFCPVSNGFSVSESASTGNNGLSLTGFIDGVMGVGSNPLF